MPLIDRVKERVETELSDDELLALIAEFEEDIEDRYGPRSAEMSLLLDGGAPSVYPKRRVSAITEIRETVGVTETVLAADDFRIRDGGRRVQRLCSGTNPRHSWGRLVAITFDPVDDTLKRDEVVIKLVELVLSHPAGTKSESIDGYAFTFSQDFETEREQLIARLAASRILLA